MLAQPALGEVDELRAGLGVLDLRDVDVAGAHACGLEGLACRVDRGRVRDLEPGDGLKTSNEAAGASGRRPSEAHGARALGVGEVFPAADDERRTLAGASRACTA